MIRSLIYVVAGGALITTASAADLPRKVAPPAFEPVPLFSWTGLYIGFNAGYAFDNKTTFRNFNNPGPNSSATGVPGSRPASLTVSADGFTGGGQAGYNYQFTPGSGVVVGVEADAAYTDLARTNGIVLTNPANNIPRLSTFRSELGFLGTVRGRIGYAFDRVLIYGTGGFAYGDVKTTTNFHQFTTTASPINFSGSTSKIETGYAVGGGIEYALATSSFLNVFKSNAVTLKVEGLYYDLGRQRSTVPAIAGSGAVGNYLQDHRTSGVLVRAGLNYKFGTY